MKPAIKSSAFWTHIAVTLSGLAATSGSVFDKSFINAHPLVAAAVSVSGLALAGLSQVAYIIGNAIIKSNVTTATTTTAGASGTQG